MSFHAHNLDFLDDTLLASSLPQFFLADMTIQLDFHYSPLPAAFETSHSILTFFYALPLLASTKENRNDVGVEEFQFFPQGYTVFLPNVCQTVVGVGGFSYADVYFGS